MSSHLPADRLEALLPALASLGRLAARGHEPGPPQLATIAAGIDVETDGAVLLELSRWAGLLGAVHRDPSSGQQDATVEALLLRGVPEAPALLAVQVAASTSATATRPISDVPVNLAARNAVSEAPGAGSLEVADRARTPHFAAASLDLGDVEPGATASIDVEIDGGPARLACDSDLLTVTPASIGPGTSTARVSMQAPRSGSVWAAVTATGPHGSATIPVIARVARPVVVVASEPLPDTRLELAGLARGHVAAPRLWTVAGTYSVGREPVAIACHGARVWVANYGSDSVSVLDATTGAVVDTVAVGKNPRGVAICSGDVWVINALGNSISRFSARTSEVRTPLLATARYPAAIATSGPYAWIANRDNDSVTRFDTASGAFRGTFGVGGSPWAIAADATGVWVAKLGVAEVVRIDPSTGTQTGVFKVEGMPSSLALDGSAVWVSLLNTDAVVRLDAATGTVLGTYPVGDHPLGIALGADSVWVAEAGPGTVTRLDAVTGTRISTFTTGSAPSAVGFGAGSVWVVNRGSRTVTRLAQVDVSLNLR